jgi:hypothetical protein
LGGLGERDELRGIDGIARSRSASPTATLIEPEIPAIPPGTPPDPADLQLTIDRRQFEATDLRPDS